MISHNGKKQDGQRESIHELNQSQQKIKKSGWKMFPLDHMVETPHTVVFWQYMPKGREAFLSQYAWE